MEHCAHAGCTCNDATIERGGQQFCSETCANAMSDSATTTGSLCVCGHADCDASRGM
jgi:hypothetical protein